MRRPVRGGAAAAVMVAAAACAPEDRVVVPLPPLAGAASAIVAYTDADGRVVVATAIDEPVLLERPAPPGPATIELLLYDAPLDALGVPAGRLAVAPEGQGGRLPSADRVYGAELVDGAATAWLPRAEPSAELRAFRALGIAASGCVPLSIGTVDLPTAVSFAVPLDEGARSILFGDNGSLYALVDREVRPLVAALPAGFVPKAGGTNHAGDVVLVSAEGRVAIGAYDGATLRMAETFTGTRTAADPRYVDGGFLEDGPEVFTLSVHGEISQLTSARARVEDRFDDLPYDAEYGGVVRVRSGSAMVGAASSRDLWLTDRPAPRLRGIMGGVSALARVDGLGVLVGTGQGEVLSEAQDFRSLGVTGSAFPITGIAPMSGGGFLFGGAQGAVGYYSPAVGFCFREQDNALVVPVWIIPRADEWVVFGKKLLSRSHAAFVQLEP